MKAQFEGNELVIRIKDKEEILLYALIDNDYYSIIKFMLENSEVFYNSNYKKEILLKYFRNISFKSPIFEVVHNKYPIINRSLEKSWLEDIYSIIIAEKL